MSGRKLADALGQVGVPEKQRKMRVQQLWNWIYIRGVMRFDEMTSVSKELRAFQAKSRAIIAAGGSVFAATRTPMRRTTARWVRFRRRRS